ncbi:MAG: hypothetical protein QY304_01005 [Candidatus Paceibacterota bacterium]|nr:MAG: hypothetical protein QY304_01005 [Candidatus Paceibacterota bacterium]
METIFTSKLSQKVRSYIVQHTPELGVIANPGVSVAVVNAADKCALTCPNCLFSAALTTKIFGGNPPAVSMRQIERFVHIMNESGLELVVFSGGGESYENLDSMCYAVEHLRHIRQVVSITSLYFANSEEETRLVLDQLTSAMLRGNQARNKKLDFVIRISFDTFHKVSVQNVARVIKYAKLHTQEGLTIRPIVRTLLDPRENLDVLLAKELRAKLVPVKNDNDPVKNLPIIDGFPTRWLVVDDIEIPVIYKPVYFLGFGKKLSRSEVPGTSWREIKEEEEVGNSFFNLSLRGRHGEGHNFYETVLRGHSYWQSELSGAERYITPRKQKEKRLCVYLPADGRFIINASAPDTWLPIESIGSWNEYWNQVSQDILQRTAVSEPTDVLLAYAKEVESDLDKILDARNFVFQIPFTAMETSALRLYLTIRILKDRAIGGVEFENPLVRELINLSDANLKQMYLTSKPHARLPVVGSEHAPRVLDPIIGNEESVWLDQVSKEDESRIRKTITNWKQKGG